MNNDERKLQTLRTIDKVDKIGVAGVVELLQKPEAEFGADLMNWQAECIGMFLSSSGAENPLDEINKQMLKIGRIRSRIDLMILLEADCDPETGKTKWDALLEMPVCHENTWNNNCRPYNIGWALDDIIETFQYIITNKGKQQ